MMFIIGFIIFSFFIMPILLLPIGAAMHTHKTKVRRRQNIEDMKTAYIAAMKEKDKELP